MKIKREVETGRHSQVVLYVNQYNELRCLILEANTTRDAEQICLIRGIKPAAIMKASTMIRDYKNRKR